MKKTILSKTLSVSETAAIFWHVFGGEKDFKKLYMAAACWDEQDEKENSNTLAQYTSKWKNSAKFQRELRRVQLLYDKFIKEVQDQAYEEGRRAAFRESTDATEDEIRMKMTGVDYTDPQRQKEKLNEIINNAKDHGEALDALKVIISGQKNDQDAAKQNKVQRFYTPLQCRECPLYNNAKEKLNK